MAELQAAFIPRWSLGDRLRKARKAAGLEQIELATEIGVSRRAVIDYENDRYQPKRPIRLSWALRCGVPLRWLESGEEKADDALFPMGSLHLEIDVHSLRAA